MNTKQPFRKLITTVLSIVASTFAGVAQDGQASLAAVTAAHQFTGSGLADTWLTIRGEVVQFRPDGTVAYTSAKGEAHTGTWSVSSGALYLTWTDQTPAPVVAMTVTAFDSDHFNVESYGGKAHSEFVRQSAAGSSPGPTSDAPLSTSLSGAIAAAGTPHLNNHGGPVAGHTSLHVMYWSSDWDGFNQPNFSQKNVNGFLSDWLKSDYFDTSGQEYGVHSGHFADANQNFFLLPAPGTSVNSLSIHSWATAMIQTPGTGVPFPCSNDDVYAVMLPPQTEIDNKLNHTCSSFGAYHLFTPILVPPFVCGLTDLGGIHISPYTIIPSQCATKDPGPSGFYNNFDELTMLMTHETIEAATDPIDSFLTNVPLIGDVLSLILDLINADPAWFDNNAGNLFTESESADICEFSPHKPEVWLNNSLVAAYWSNKKNDCAAGPGVVRDFTLAQTGVPAGIPVRVTFDSRTPDVNHGAGFSIQVATNTSHSYSFPATVIGPTAGTRFTTSQPPATVNVTDTFAVTASYHSQFLLTVNTSPAAAATGNASLTPTDFHDAGQITIHADQDVPITTGTRYDFASWGGDISAATPDFSFTLSAPTTATANYTLQDLVNFNSNGIPNGTPWRVTVDGAQHPGPFGDWVNQGSAVHYSYQVVVPALTAGTCFVLTGVSPASPLTVSNPATVTGTYATQTVPQAITNYRLLKTQPAAGGLTLLTYTADAVNCGKAFTSISARVDSLEPGVTPVSGFRTLGFAAVAANSQTSSADVFELLVKPGVTVDLNKLVWSFRTLPGAPQAVAGPTQTVKVGATVTLDGSGSMDNGGGPLTYAWTLLSVPAGSKARLQNTPGPITTFVADMPGAYVARLEVITGIGSSSDTVTITAAQ